MRTPEEVMPPETVERRVKTGGAKGQKDSPPEWASERFFKMIGRGPAAVGKVLDRLAKVPVIGRVVGFFSSVWVGIAWLFLLGLYIGVGSGMPGVRAKFEMTDLQFFDAWPMQVILTGLAITLTVVTLRRIPLTVFKLGVWMVHVGILTLIGGAVWYFSHKLEGSVRIYLNHRVDWYFDATERALYAFRVGEDGNVVEAGSTMTPLPTLPFFYEHLPELANPLSLALPSATTDGLAAGVKVTITGYYPAADLVPVSWRGANAGETGVGRAIAIQLDSGGRTSPEAWLIAGSPAQRVMQRQDLPFAVEYLYHPTPDRLRDLQESFAGTMGMTVRVPAAHFERTYAVKAGEPIAITGTGYTLTPGDVNAMPMLSKGYENAMSSALMVHVERKETAGGVFAFDRMAVFRYPERSPDFVNENGKQVRKQNGVDPGIEIIFHDASEPQFWVVEDEAGNLTLISRGVDGKTTTEAFGKDGASMAASGLTGLRMKIAEEVPDAVQTFAPMIIPPEQRQRGQTAMDAMQGSIVELRVSKGDWTSDPIYVPFVQFAQIGEPPAGREPSIVDVPGAGRVGFLFSTTRRSLPSAIQLTDFSAVKYPGAMNTYENYVSTLAVTPKDGEAAKTLTPQLNDPAADQGLYYFQAAWDGDDHATADKRFSVIGVGNRPGIWVMAAGAILLVFGIGYSFYVKPVLLRMKKEGLARWATTRGTV